MCNTKLNLKENICNKNKNFQGKIFNKSKGSRKIWTLKTFAITFNYQVWVCSLFSQLKYLYENVNLHRILLPIFPFVKCKYLLCCPTWYAIWKHIQDETTKICNEDKLLLFCPDQWSVIIPPNWALGINCPGSSCPLFGAV